MRTLRFGLLCLLPACLQAYYGYTVPFGVNRTMAVEVDVSSFESNDAPSNPCWFNIDNEQVTVTSGFIVEYDPVTDWQLYVECGTGATILIDESTDAYGVQLEMPNCGDVKNTCYLLKYNDSYGIGGDTGGTDTGGSDTAAE